MTNLLWICSYGQIRSVTAAGMYGGKYLGISNRYHEGLFEEYIRWADEIYIFEDTKDGFNTKLVKKLYPNAIGKIMKQLFIMDVFGVVKHYDLIQAIRHEIAGLLKEIS